MDIQQRFEQDPAVVCRHIGTEMVLVPVRSASDSMTHIFALNDTAALVWDHLPATMPDLVVVMVAEYEIDESAARSDVEELLLQMTEAQLIREVSDGTLP